MQEWRAIELVEPWGERRMDLLFARMTAFIANLVRNEDKHPEPYTTKDFQIDWEELWKEVSQPPAALTEEEELARSEGLLGKVMAINTIFGGTTA